MIIDPSIPREFSYPSWHDRVRAKKGHHTAQAIADMFGANVYYVSQILSPEWKKYIVRYALQPMDKTMTLNDAKNLLAHPKCAFKFVAKDILSPAEKKLGKKKVGSEVSTVGKLREFEPDSTYRDGKTFKGAKIRCKVCGEENKYFGNQGSVSTEHLEKEFSRMGWLIGANPNQDVCRNCRDRRTEKNSYKAVETKTPKEIAMTMFKEINEKTAAEAVLSELPVFKPDVVVSQPVVKGVEKVTMPAAAKAMDRTERRLVFARLNELYQDEKTGYSGDWTDAKVAEDLGVAVQWVAEVRDQDFGPELNASILAGQTKRLEELGDKISRTVVLVDKKLEQLQGLDEKVNVAMDEIEKAIQRFDQLRKSLETEDNRIEDLLTGFREDVKLFNELKASASN